MQQPRLPETEPGRFIAALRRDGGGGGAGRRDPGADVRQPRHHVRGARRGRPAVHPGDDLRGARRPSRTLPGRCRRIRPFLDNSDRSCSATCSPAVEALPQTAPTIADGARGRARRSLPPRRRSTSSCPDRASRCCAFNNEHGGPRRASAACDRPTDILGPTLRFITPAQTVCNYATLLSATSKTSTARAADSATVRCGGSSCLRGPAGRPEQRGQPLVGARQRRGRPTATSCTPTPIRTPRRPASRECEAGNEPTSPARQVIGNVPGNQGTATKRV